MHNEQKEMLLSTLEDIKYSLELILKRANNINSSDDFLKDENGLQKLDSIAMRLSAIGEGFKNIDKLSNNQLLIKYPNIPWKNVKGIIDILSHHYFDLDAEVIFNICKKDANELLETTIKIIEELN
ncbi:HepT-like ribonuclease domain-containing protein [Aliarcobacter cryaerophilus]|uniref:HepT-like ribonuclease domain-containing protein n=1 Tax=Aliarcobacter cryaerophilus TaxID=28198 RepID=UPI00082658FE|nr:HepT-like ribonuclease domain-containing protein [Aliarcobacter cryaerophilus]